MQTFRTIRFASSVLVLLASASGAARAAGQTAPIALRAAVEVRGENIYLSDLLPQGAAAEWRGEAGQWKIAASPEPGMSRTLTARELSRLLAGAEAWSGQLLIPSTVSIHREARNLSAEEVARLLEARGAVIPDRTLLHTPQVAIPAEAEVRIEHVRYDAATRQTSVYLSLATSESTNSRQTIQARLIATIPGNFASIVPGGQSPQALVPVPQRAAVGRASTLKEPAIMAARRGERTLALVELPGVRITQAVVPLRDGALGETIPVRESGSQQRRDAVVIGPARVRLLPAAGPAQIARGRQEFMQ